MAMVETSPLAGRWEALLHEVLRERSGEPAIVRAMREEAFARFAALGFPTTAQEEWRLTPVHPIASGEWESAPGEPAEADIGALEAHRIADAATELVFVDGRFDRERSRIGAAAGITFRRLADALASPDGELTRLGSLAQDGTRPFVALNTALMTDGAVVDVAADAEDGVVHLLFVSSGGSRAISPRVLVRAGRGARASVVETHTGAGRYFTNPVTELFAGAGSVVDHYRIVDEDAEGYHVGAVAMRQERDATVHSRLIGLGGPLARTDLATILDGEGASCTLDGLYLLGGSEHFDAHTRIEHAKPHTDSLELYKGVLAGKARGVFNGLVVVRPDAQKITARQTNKNLLLSNDAIADSNPQLEIHANDVKCNHGSTIGQLDPTALFYLRSRGIGLDQAKAMLTWAFAAEVIERIKIDAVRRRLRTAVETRLGGGAGGTV